MDKRAWQAAADLNVEWGKARKTLPGIYSDFLDRLLYDRSECPGATEDSVKPAFPDRIYLGVPEPEKYLKWNGRDGDYADTVKTLREIAELLEAYAYRAMKNQSTT